MVNVSWNEFWNSVTSCGFSGPNRAQHSGFNSSLDLAGISSKREAAMFLAQLIHESEGLQQKEEIKYRGCTSSPYDRTGGYSGRSYHGRGYIQLSHAYNYRAASEFLFGDDRLLRDPDLVCQSEDYAFQTAAWFWKDNVGCKSGVKNGRFGCSTGAINGGLEPQGSENPHRFKYYCKVLDAFGIRESPDPSW